MMTTADRILLTFDLDQNHLYKMDDVEWRFAYQTNGTVTFTDIADPYRKVTYDVGTLNRMNGAGKIEMVPYGLLPQEMRPKTFQCDVDTTMAGLDPKTRQRANMREAMVLAYEDLYARGVFKAIDEQIAEAMPQIRDAAAELLAEFDLEYKAKLRDWKAGTGRKPQSKNTVAFPDSVSARQLRTWVSAYRNGGKRALVDNCKNRGNVNSFFTAEEIGLMAKVINEEYLTLQRKTIKIVAEHVKVEFAAVNKARAENGEAPLRVPSKEAVRKFIKRMNKFHVLVARFGQQEAMNRMRPTSMGVQVSRPLERVEMDECKIDLLTLLAKSGLLEMFAPEDRERLGLGDKKRRWWLIMAIDCRTRCILGMVLTANPNSVGTLKCLRMVVSDKGQFADKVGALAPWSMFGTPEAIFVDNGSGLASALVTDACADLGIQKVQTIAGMASMRGQIEGMFNTLSVSLFPRLSGRTFGNVVERAKHPAEARTCHDLNTLATVLVRYIVDVYHNTPHQGLGGRTPLQQWETDLAEGNYPLMPAPSLRKKRIALGLPTKRHVRKDGIVVMNVRYQSETLAEWFLANGDKIVEVRWFDENIGSIEVNLDGLWYEIPSLSSVVQDVDATTWAATRRALAAKDPKRKAWEEDVVAKALADIRAINADRMAAYHIMDHGWTAEALAEQTAHAKSTFEIIKNREKTSQTDDGYGKSITPSKPERPSKAKDAVENAPKQAPAQRKWNIVD